PIVVKIHGAVDRLDPEHDSFVITEDHYIDYLTRTDVRTLLPVPLPAKLQRSQFLFMGYSLRDWNLRAILHRLAGDRRLSSLSWAVQRAPTDLDKRFWLARE